MEEYPKEILKDLPEDMNGTATIPAANHLLKVRDNVPKLNEERAEFSILWWRNCCLLHTTVDLTFKQWFPF